MTPQVRLSGLFTWVAELLTRWSEPGKQTASTDETDIELAEADHMVAGLEFGDADQFIDQRLADEDVLPFHLISPLLRTRRTW